jgi:hypothetical protein
MSEEKHRDHTIVERHLQTTIQVIIVAIILWFGNEVTDNGKSLISLTTKLDVFASTTADHETRLRAMEKVHRVDEDD